MQNGCYLIRKSKKGGETKPYTLAIFYESQVFNLNIRKKPNHQYALGMAKPGEQVHCFIDLSLYIIDCTLTNNISSLAVIYKSVLNLSRHS